MLRSSAALSMALQKRVSVGLQHYILLQIWCIYGIT